MSTQGRLPVLTISALAIVLLAGCASRETYIVLPDNKGQAGSITITPKEGPALKIEGAYASAIGKTGSTPALAKLSEAEIRAGFAETLSARPDAPIKFTLYFKEGSDELTPESKKDFSSVLAEVKQRPAPDIIVVGHTDRVGLAQENDRLALRRAEKMRQELIRLGLPEDCVQAASRGERDPLVITADEIAEPKNRRVEMLVR